MDTSTRMLTDIHPSVYRAAIKLQSLQKRCCLDVVFVRHIMVALPARGGAKQQGAGTLSRQEVMQSLDRMFNSVSQEVPGHVTVAAPEETCTLVFTMFDRCHSGHVMAVSLHAALVCLSAETLQLKLKALVCVADSGSGLVSRSSLRSLLDDVSQVPMAVQEEGVFGSVAEAVMLCFNGVPSSTASIEHVLSWLQSGPSLLIWLPTLHRLCVSQKVSHAVRCHTCKTFPIMGLRYRCRKCVNIQVCQSCFLSEHQTRKHKRHHPVLEFCTQPTWRETLSSLLSSARYALSPRRYSTREMDRRRELMWAEPEESRTLPPADAVIQPATSAGWVSSDHPRPRSDLSGVLQAEETMVEQLKAETLLTDVRNLQRDKWLMEQELQVWRLAVQSEQGMLEDRCTQMEVTMETLREHNLQLQGMLSQALTKTEAQQHITNTPSSHHTENKDMNNGERRRPTWSDVGRNGDLSNEEDNEKEYVMEMEAEWKAIKQQTPSPTIPHDTETCAIQLEAGQKEDTCSSAIEDCGTRSPEELLQDTVDRLKTGMMTGRWMEPPTGGRKRAELLEAADQVGALMHHLVQTVRTDWH